MQSNQTPQVKLDNPIVNTQNIDDSIQDQELSIPSSSQTAYTSFKKGFLGTIYGLDVLDHYTHNTNMSSDEDTLKDTMDSYSSVLNRDDLSGGQKALDWGTNILGFALNPLNLLTGEVTSLGVGKALGVAGDLLPEAATSVLNKPLTSIIGEDSFLPKVAAEQGSKRIATIGETGTLSAKAAAIGATTMLPQEIADNYNSDTNSINWGGVVKGTAENGGLGLLLPSLPFVAGTAWKKVFGSDATLPEVGKSFTDGEQAQIEDSASEGKISNDEAKLLTNLQVDPNEENLKPLASQIASKQGLNVDRSGHTINVGLLNQSDWESLNSAMWDQAGSDGEVSENDSKNLSDFIIKNRMDNVLSDANNLRDGVQSTIDFMQRKENEKVSKLAEADNILDKHMMKGVNQNKDFSQEKIYKAMQRASFEPSHLENSPLILPDNIAKKVSLEKRISELQSKVDPKKPNKQLLKRIKELQSQVPEVMTPKEELTDIREKLLTKDGLPDNYQNTNAYQRLSQLAEAWPHAASLLDRIHLEDDYEKQASYKNVLQSLKSMMDSPLQKLAEPKNVTDYLQQRVEASSQDFRGSPEENEEEPFKTENPVVEKESASLDSLEQEVRSTGASGLKEVFNDSKNRFEEFNTKKSVFENLISCIMG